MRSSLLLLVTAMLSHSGAAHAQSQTQSLAPAGWSETTRGSSVMYMEPNKDAMITITSGPLADNHDVDFRDAVKGMFSDPKLSKCPDIEYIRSNVILDDKARELVVSENSIVCAAMVGQQAGKAHMVYVFGLDDPRIDAPGKARAILGRMMGLSQSGQAARFDIQIPSGPIQRKSSVESSGNYGVWVAIVNKTVYDPNMGIRMELGTDYLVLTKGGYFMDYLPNEGGFDDATAKRMMAEQPEGAGTYTMAGNRINLRYADGKTKTALRNGDNIEHESEDYVPKRYFADGTALQGAYGSTSITATGVGFVVGEHDFDFAPDGRFGHGRAVSMTSAAVSTVGGREGRGGRYYIKDSAIHLAYDDGEREVMPIWQESVGGPIWIGGEMYKPAGSE
jgi:hypothetical protein